MRSSDHRYRAGFRRESAKGLAEVGDFNLRAENRIFHVESHVNRHLVVTAASGVYLLSEVSEFLRKADIAVPIDSYVDFRPKIRVYSSAPPWDATLSYTRPSYATLRKPA